MAPMPSSTVNPHEAPPDALRAPAVSSSEYNVGIQASTPSSNGSKRCACETDLCNGETIAPAPSQVSPLFAADAPLPLQNRDIAPATKATRHVVLAPLPSRDHEIPVSPPSECIAETNASDQPNIEIPKYPHRNKIEQAAVLPHTTPFPSIDKSTSVQRSYEFDMAIQVPLPYSDGDTRLAHDSA